MRRRGLELRVAIATVGVATVGGLAPLRASADVNFTWTPAGFPARSGAALAFDDATGTGVLFGGGENGAIAGDTWTWDGLGWTPQTPAHSPSPRSGAAAAYDAADQEVVLFGGAGDSGASDETWTWDGTTADWTLEQPASSPPATNFPRTAYDAAHQQVVLLDNGETWTWDGTTANWTHEQPADSPSFSTPTAMAYDAATGTVVAFGTVISPPGCIGPSCLYSATYTWDGTDWTLAAGPGCPSARSRPPSMAYDADHQQVVLFGGFVRPDSPCPDGGGDTWTWDGSSWTQQSPTDSPAARYGAAAIYDPVAHDVLLFGGGTGAGDLYNDWWTWDGTTDDWTEQSPNTNPAPREGLSMAYDDAQQEVVLFGGGDCCSSRADTWTWDGAVWAQQSPVNSPPGRIFAAMAYDSDHQDTVLFGGVSGGSDSGDLLGDTWTWDGTTANWTLQTPADTPSAREGPSMAYDAADHEAVLYGGETGSCGSVGYCGDTWTWDGATNAWTKQRPDHSPPAGGFGSMTYDPFTGTAVLFGGECDVPHPGLCGDTWTWDGATNDWTKQPVDSPPPREQAQMAYDPTTDTVVLFGGSCWNSDTGTVPCKDTWEWNGTDWTKLAPAQAPPARRGGGMAFDSNGNALLFGGFVADPGVDSGSFSYGFKPTVVRILGPAGGTVATKPSSAKHPLATSVTVGQTDAGGRVSIAQLTRSTQKAPAGFAFLPAQDVIAAPRGSPASPLTLEFTLDPSLLAGDPIDPVSLFRTEFGHKTTQVGACTSQTPPTPDPCISNQSTSVDGSVHFTVLGSSASTWNFALPGVSRSLSIGYHHGRLFKGKLSSSKHACVAGQKVTVFRKKSGPDHKAGTDKTSSTGAYKVRERDAKGKYYASVPPHEEPGLGICEAAKSKTLRP